MRNILATVVLILASACSGNNLDRADAAQLILETQQAAALSERVSAYSGYIEDGEAQGLWTTENSRDPVMDTQISEQISELGDSFVRPTAPAQIKIEVTGITDAGDQASVKSAEFQWQYANLPRYIRRFAQAGGSGQASFQKFDDGWRVLSVSFLPADSRTLLSDAEVSEIRNDISIETARRTAIYDKIRISFSQGRPIKSYEVDFYGEKHRYAIFENGVAGYKDIVEHGWTTGKLEQSWFVSFGFVFNLREGDWGVLYDASPEGQREPERFDTTHYKMDTKDFLQTAIAAHAEWTRKFGDLPLPLRRKVYHEQQSRN